MDAWNIVNLSAQGVIGTAAAVGNALVLYVIKRNKSLQNVNNYLIASLATADLLVGLIGMPVSMVNHMGLPHNFYGCLIMSCIIILLTQVSIHGLAAIALERLIAIRFPIFHRKHFNKRMAVLIIIIAWTSAILIGLVPVFGWNLGPHPSGVCAFVFVIDFSYMVYFNFFGFVFTPLVIMFITYGYIFYVIRSRSKRMNSDQANQAQNVTKKNLKKESKAAQRIFFVLVLFTVCWLPLHLSNTLSHLTGLLCLPCVVVFVLMSYLNSAINPFLYAYGNPQFQAAILQSLHCYTRVEPLANVSGVNTVSASGLPLGPNTTQSAE